MLEKFIVTGPTFVTVTVTGECVVRTFVYPKEMLPGESLRTSPTPFRLTVLGLLGSESKMFTLPL
jgi:hypothetical protein